MDISKDELEALENSEFLKIKFLLSKNITDELQKISNEMISRINILESSHILKSFLKPAPKVSRGENYQQLPYFILDYPRHFKDHETLAIRNMILWGEFISSSLQLSGKFKKNIEEKILKNELDFKTIDDWYICVNSTPWEHHFGRNNFLPFRELNSKFTQNIFKNQNFIKLTRRHDIKEITNLSQIILSDFQEFISLLK